MDDVVCGVVCDIWFGVSFNVILNRQSIFKNGKGVILYIELDQSKKNNILSIIEISGL